MSFAAREKERQAAEEALLARLRERRAALNDLLARSSDHWGYEDPVYRFYHQSFKVYHLQEQTTSIVAALGDLAPGGLSLPVAIESSRAVCRSGVSEQFHRGCGREVRVARVAAVCE